MATNARNDDELPGSRRVAALVPAIGLVVAVVTFAVMAGPGPWASEPDVLVFSMVLLLLLVVPHAALLVVLWRSTAPQWLWGCMVGISALATVGQILVGVVMFTADDPQMPILLTLYAPIQFVVVGLLLLLALGIGLVSGRTQGGQGTRSERTRQASP